MHNPLAQLPKRVLLDTNVLLDATFVNGLARSAVALLRSLGFDPSIDQKSLDDGDRILRGLTTKLNLRFDPTPHLKEFVAQTGILIVPAATDFSGVVAINKTDKHVVAATCQYEGWLLTSDTPLIVEAQGLVEARLPWDVVAEANIKADDPLAISIIRTVPVSAEEGSIFARVTPGGWAGKKTSANLLFAMSRMWVGSITTARQRNGCLTLFWMSRHGLRQ